MRQGATLPKLFAVAILIVAGVALILSGQKDSGTPSPVAAGSAPSVSKQRVHTRPQTPIDESTIYDSLAAVAAAHYSKVNHDHYRPKVGSGDASCEAKGSGFQCGVPIELGILGVTELWGYRLKMVTRDCWSATTLDRYGAYQDDVDSYQNRSLLAPSRSDVRHDLRIVAAMRPLHGCVRPPGGRLAGSDHVATFLAGLAAEDVQLKYPGAQRTTRCRSLGKETVALAPDSWNYYCRTFLAAGKSYVDKLICFDPPPYSTFNHCGAEDGYPKRPPRRLP